MAKAGFIHDKLDIKFLVLYLMARVASPVDFSTLADLTFCDDGVEYFDFAAALAELVDTGHLELKDDKYSITEKGRRNGKICEGNIMTLDLLTVSEEQAGRLAEKFRTHPERLYDSILQVLLETEEEG